MTVNFNHATNPHAIVLDEAQITAIVVKHLADYWGVPESAIKGAVEVTDWGARCEGRFSACGAVIPPADQDV